MLVVVYLVDAKMHVIIPQNWIMGLTQENLNNFGKASYQTRRVFWSKNETNHETIPGDSIVPNFHLPLCNIFPPLTSEACYIARVKRYCCEYI